MCVCVSSLIINRMKIGTSLDVVFFTVNIGCHTIATIQRNLTVTSTSDERLPRICFQTVRGEAEKRRSAHREANEGLGRGEEGGEGCLERDEGSGRAVDK